jgi:hypothetical protein
MALKIAYPQSGKHFWKKNFVINFVTFIMLPFLRYHAVVICYIIDIVVFYYH